jgi:hypothetical protein
MWSSGYFRAAFVPRSRPKIAEDFWTCGGSPNKNSPFPASEMSNCLASTDLPGGGGADLRRQGNAILRASPGVSAAVEPASIP